MVVTDTNDIYMPCQADDLLINLYESYDLVLNLLDNFNNYFVNSLGAKT